MFAIGSWTRLLRLLGILQGIPESLRICAELQSSSGITRLELGLIRSLTFGYRKDNDDDDRDSEADVVQSDRNYVRMHSIHNRFTYSVPASAPREHPRWGLWCFFSTSEVISSAKPIVTLYPRVDEILDSHADRATRFAKESKPLHRVLPFKRKATPEAIDRIFVWLVMLIQFFLICLDRRGSYIHASSMTLSYLEKLDQASQSLIAGQSQSF